MNDTVITTALWGPDDLSYADFIPDFAKSLGNQTVQDFKVHATISPNFECRFRDEFNCAGIAPDRLIVMHLDMKSRAPNNLDVAHARFSALDEMLDPTAKIICLDIDDSRPADYVEKMSLTIDEGADIAVADHWLTGTGTDYDHQPYLMNRFKPGEIIKIDDIVHGNIGLWSNTAFRKKVLPHMAYDSLAHADPILAPAGDWIMTYSALSEGRRAVMAPTNIFYLQGNNLSGITQTGPDALHRTFEIKRAFYRHVQALDLPGAGGELAREMHQKFRDATFNKRDHLIKQCGTVHERFPMLWERVLIPN